MIVLEIVQIEKKKFESFFFFKKKKIEQKGDKKSKSFSRNKKSKNETKTPSRSFDSFIIQALESSHSISLSPISKS